MKDGGLERYIYNTTNQEQAFDLLIEKYPWAEEYIFYYIYVIFAPRESISPTLERIAPEDRAHFTTEKGYEYLKQYEKERLGLATIIPTCNRPDAIKYLLNIAATLYRRLGIDLIIFDSSDEDDTREIVDDFRKFGFYNVRYVRYEGEFDGFSLDHKVIASYETFWDDYNYLWVCRDGIIPIADDLLEQLRHCARHNVGCVIVDTKNRTNGLAIAKTYSTLEDCEDLLRDQGTRLQTLGMLIFSSEYAKKLVAEEPLTDDNYSLWQMAAPLHLFAKEPYRIEFFSRDIFAFNACASTTHFWSKPEKAFRQWAYRWHQVVTKLPDAYNAAKDDVMMIYTVDFHPFTMQTIMEMRAYGGLTKKIVRKYEEYIPKVTKTPMRYFQIVSAMPPFVARLILKIYRRCPERGYKLKENIKKVLS